MKFDVLKLILSASIAMNSITAQSISASYSLIHGSPWTGDATPARVPLSYALFSPMNTPGGRSNHKIIVHNNLIYAFHGVKAPANDVWAFNIADRTWAWMAGNSTSSSPIFGPRGLASVLYTPGFRFNFGGDIHRIRGEYILFGGATLGGDRGDLWTFNLTSNAWKWMAGQSSAVENPIYNSIGKASATTTPGARKLAICFVFPLTGEFLLYGGLSNQYFSDMWAFSFIDLRWSWISGSSLRNVGSSAGPKGEGSTGYFPAARASSHYGLNRETRTLYIFGGSDVGGYLNDLWSFKRETLQWAWISGSLSKNQAGICGSLGYPSSNNTPGARYYHTMAYHYPSNLLILFGGDGYSCEGQWGTLSDSWAFNTSSRKWAWIGGSSLNDHFSVDYMTLSAQSGSGIAVDNETSDIYMFGGYGFVSQSSQENVDYVWAAKISTIPMTLSSKSKISLTGSNSYYISSDFDSTKSGLDVVDTISTIAEKIWLFKFLMLGIFGTMALLVVFCVANKLYSRRSKTDETAGPATSSTISSFQTSTTTTSYSAGHTTLVTSTAAVYLPGGLLFDGNLSYRMETELARGGGGSVWLATAFDPELKEYGETVIVKIPNSKLMNDRAVALFYQEIALMNAFRSSRNIAKLLGYSEKPYSTIMKYYRTGSLTKWISSGVRTMRQSLAFMSDISEGVYELHYNGIVHCDLKPDNILIESGWRLFAVITDFGISRIVTDKLLKVTAYEVQLIKGASLTYAAPEVIRELQTKNVSRKPPYEIMARDIYSFGVVLYALLNERNVWETTI